MTQEFDKQVEVAEMVQAGEDPLRHNREVARNENLKPSDYPGRLKIAVERGHAVGGLAVEFDTAEEVNDYFNAPGRDNHLIHHISSTGKGTILVIYSKVLTEEELQEHMEVQVEVQRMLEERKARRAEAEDKEREKAAKAVEEERRLAGVGRKCEANHGALVEELRKLKGKKK